MPFARDDFYRQGACAAPCLKCVQMRTGMHEAARMPKSTQRQGKSISGVFYPIRCGCEKIPPRFTGTPSRYFIPSAVDAKKYHPGPPGWEKYSRGIFSKPPWIGKNTTGPFCAPAASMTRRKVNNTALVDRKYLGYKKYLCGLY